jgi:hypothetical protein
VARAVAIRNPTPTVEVAVLWRRPMSRPVIWSMIWPVLCAVCETIMTRRRMISIHSSWPAVRAAVTAPIMSPSIWPTRQTIVH